MPYSGGISSGIQVVFDTVAAVNNATISATVNTIIVDAYDATALALAYGVHPAVYQRVTTTTAPLLGGQISSNAGAVTWQLCGTTFYLDQFGTSTDNFQAALLNTQMFFNVQASATVTFTGGGSPVINWTAHNLAPGQSVYFTTTGSLPVAITINTLYYVVSTTTNSFQIATTINGTPINMTTAGTGTTTGIQAGLGVPGDLILPPATVTFPSTIYYPITLAKFMGHPYQTTIVPLTGVTYDQNYLMMYNMLAGGTNWQTANVSMRGGCIGYFTLSNTIGINISFLLYSSAPLIEKIYGYKFIQVCSGITNQYSDQQTVRDISLSQQPVIPSTYTTSQACCVSIGGGGGDAVLIENIAPSQSGVGPSGGIGMGIYLQGNYGGKISRIINGNIFITNCGSVTVENGHFEQGSVFVQNADVKIRDCQFWNNAFNYTVTLTLTSPGVATITSQTASLQNGQTGYFTTTGTLPTGLTAGTVYYIVNYTGQTFQVAATPGGTAINFTVAQSGVQTFTTISIPIQIPNAAQQYVNGWSNTVVVENCSFRSQQGANFFPPNPTTGTFANLPWPDIWVTQGNLLQIRDCHRQWIQNGSNNSSRSNSLMGIVVAGGANLAPSPLTAFNSKAGIASTDCMIDWDQTVNVTKTVKMPAVPSTFSILDDTESNWTWPLASGIYTYAYTVYADTTRQIGSVCTATAQSISLTNGSNHFPKLVLFTSLGNIPDHCVYRFFRSSAGGGVGAYTSYVDIPMLHGGFPIDYGTHLDGFPWISRASSGVDTVALTGFIGRVRFEGVNIQAMFNTSTAIPTPAAGTFVVGDEIDQSTPTLVTLDYQWGSRCSVAGTPGTWNPIFGGTQI